MVKLSQMKWDSYKQGGFTIVELLIVVVVIAILAAITIVSYNGITARAYTASVQSDMRNALQKLELYRADNGAYPVHTSNTELAAAKIYITKANYSTTGGNFLYCVNNGTGRVALSARGTNGTTYAISNQRAFGEYATNPVSDYANTCLDLVGANSARYGHVTGETPQWRVWINP